MTDLRARLPAQSLMQKTLELHPAGSPPPAPTLSWYLGAIGEIAVAGILSQLGPDWTVLHSVPVGRRDKVIDHVVIGPAGVFTINTKNHAGQDVWVGGRGLFVSGSSTRYVLSAAEEAEDAAERLSSRSGMTVPVTPLVVFVAPGKRSGTVAPERNVEILADSELLARLLGRPVFSDAQTATIAAVAVRASTWHEHPAPEVDTSMLAIQFNAILAWNALPNPSGTVAAAASRTDWLHTPIRFPVASKARASPPRKRSARDRRRSAKRGEALAQLIGLGIVVWAIYAIVLPAMQHATP